MHSSSILASIVFVALTSALPTATTPSIIARSTSCPIISVDYSSDKTFARKNTVPEQEIPLDSKIQDTEIGPIRYIRSQVYHLDTHCSFWSPTGEDLFIDLIDAEAGVYELQSEVKITSVRCRSGGEIENPHTTISFRAVNEQPLESVDIPNDGVEYPYEHSATSGVLGDVMFFDQEAIQYCDFKGPDGWLARPNEHGTFEVPSVITAFKCSPEQYNVGGN